MGYAGEWIATDITGQLYSFRTDEWTSVNENAPDEFGPLRMKDQIDVTLESWPIIRQLVNWSKTQYFIGSVHAMGFDGTTYVIDGNLWLKVKNDIDS